MKQPVERIHHNNSLLAIIIRSGYTREGIEFFTPNDFSQQLAYIKRPAGYRITPHTHNAIITKSGDTEGLPVVIQEGLAAGKPIIASDVGGIRDIIKDGWNGFLIEQKKPDRIAAKILELLNNEELITAFSKNAVETSDVYDWGVIANKYRNIVAHSF